MKILCVGEALIDMICTDHGMSLSEGQHFLKKPGGAPANVAAAIAALGGQVDLLAKVGRDPFGKQLITEMESFGVNTRYIFTDETYFTTMAFVSLMLDGERDFVFNRGADGQLNIAEIESLDLSPYTIIHFGSATAFLPGPLQSAYLLLMKKAIDNDIFISFDPNYRHLLFGNNVETFIRQSLNFINKCDFFKVSEEEANLITESKCLKEATLSLMKMTDAVFAITLGKEGTLFRKGAELITIPSISVNPIDTTGAGDAFVGAVLFQLAQTDKTFRKNLTTETWENIISNANKAGARTCLYLGAMEAFRHLSIQIFK